jgi:5'-3' exonuclease
MGVPYYFYVITQQHKGILRKECPAAIRRFYLDYNGGVHPVCHRLLAAGAAGSDFETRLCEEAWTYLMSLVQMVRPKEVFVMLDGVAPVAKIQQQRKRRYLSILRQKMLRTFSAWDTNAISPGTEFMKQLNQTFRDKIQQTFSAIPMHFNGSDEAGEGEHKIFDHLAATATDTSTGATVIYGLDADLIMLSLLSHQPRIFLMREQEEGFVYLDIDALRIGILQTLRHSYQWPVPEIALEDAFSPEACNLLENYTVTCFLLGNDFLPNVPSLHLKKEGLPCLLRAFKDTWDECQSLLVQREAESPISFEFLARWLERLAKSEDTQIHKLNEDYAKKRCFVRTEEDKVEFYPLMPEHKSRLTFEIQAQPLQWRRLYYKHLMDSERQDRTVVVDACREYLTGILWTYSYYTRRPKPYDWYYPFGVAPTLLDLANQLSGDLPYYTDQWTRWTSEVPQSLPMTLQLLAILPIESHGLLPSAVQARVRDPRFGIRYMFPTGYPLWTYMKQHLWECHPKLPMLDFKALRRAVSGLI